MTVRLFSRPFFSRRPVQAWLLWLLLMAAGVLVIAQSRFVADLSFFLPSRPTPAQQVLISQFREGVVSRLLMLGITGGTPEQRARISRALQQQLSAAPEFAGIQNGSRNTSGAEQDFLFRYRYVLSPAVTAERFAAPGLQQAIREQVDLLASPLGMMLKPYFSRDPSGELAALLTSLTPPHEPASRLGVWASRDGERAVLLAQTRALGSDTDGQVAAIRTLRHTFAALCQQLNTPGLALELSGPGVFAAQARQQIEREVHLLSLFSSLCIIVVLFFVYRSLRQVGLGLLPVLTGAVFGMVAVSLVHGEVFGITVGFGSALIGEAVDYSIYYFVQAGRLGVPVWQARFWPTIRLGVLTSVSGFAALLFSGFPGLSQLGLYALSGVLAAAIVTRLMLPAVSMADLSIRDLSPMDARLRRLIGYLQRWRGPLLLLTLAALPYLLLQPRLWSTNLSVLNPVSHEDARRDQQLRADLNAPDARYMVVVQAKTEEEALQAAEKTARILNELVSQGKIGGFDTPTTFLPSLATQQQRQAALPDAATLNAALQTAVQGLPVRAETLQPFATSLAAARQMPPLTRDALNGTAFALVVDALLRHHPQHVLPWQAVLPLRPAAGQTDFPVAALRQALAGQGALFIDLKGEFEQLYQDYSREATLLALAGFAAIVLLLAITRRSVRRIAALLRPLLLTVILVMAGLRLHGETLHLIHLIGLLLIIAVGSNYALFFDQGSGMADEPGTLSSMALANLTTTIGFGTLALSSVPVLHAIGITVGPGVVLALLLSAMFLHPPADCPTPA